ncbi:hypothetical protein DRO97_01810 [Archaeoglobales archaeon]|nr:MAG: hypothetical protein DRO97_01810 [Archaeoglobales archaeon]
MKYDHVSSIDEAYIQTMIFLARTFPQLYFLSKHLRVVYNENAEYIALTDGRSIKLSSRWFLLPYHARLAIFMHNLYHVLLKHPLRCTVLSSNYDLGMILVACDAKTNYLLMKSLENKMSDPSIYSNILSTFGIPEELLEKASVEEIVKWMIDQQPQLSQPQLQQQLTAGEDIQLPSEGSGEGEAEDDEDKKGSGKGEESGEEGGDDTEDSSDGDTDSTDSQGDREENGDSNSEKVLNEGKQDLVNSNLEDLEKELNKVIRDSLISAKIAGAKLSAIEERILGSLTKSKVDWRTLIPQWLTSHLKKNVVQSFIRPNRKFSYLPGLKAIGKPKAYCFVDVSGSVSNDEFRDYLSAVAGAFPFVDEVYMVTWDTVVIDEFEFKSKRELMEIVSKVRFKGGGGTKFAPAISKFIRQIKPEDVFVCLTDGHWFDLDEASNLVKNVRALKILVTTDVFIPNFDKAVKIREEEF